MLNIPAPPLSQNYKESVNSDIHTVHSFRNVCLEGRAQLAHSILKEELVAALLLFDKAFCDQLVHDFLECHFQRNIRFILTLNDERKEI